LATILVVDDEPEILQFIGTALEDEGHRVLKAADGWQAVDIAAQQRPDMIVLDMMLPGMDGDVVASEMRRLYGEGMPILLITADGQAQQKAERVGAFSHLSKPFDLDRLIGLVSRRLGSS
jgi:CheY-like chemotaxis protein